MQGKFIRFSCSALSLFISAVCWLYVFLPDWHLLCYTHFSHHFYLFCICWKLLHSFIVINRIKSCFWSLFLVKAKKKKNFHSLKMICSLDLYLDMIMVPVFHRSARERGSFKESRTKMVKDATYTGSWKSARSQELFTLPLGKAFTNLVSSFCKICFYFKQKIIM